LGMLLKIFHGDATGLGQLRVVGELGCSCFGVEGFAHGRCLTRGTGLWVTIRVAVRIPANLPVKGLLGKVLGECYPSFIRIPFIFDLPYRSYLLVSCHGNYRSRSDLKSDLIRLHWWWSASVWAWRCRGTL